MDAYDQAGMILHLLTPLPATSSALMPSVSLKFFFATNVVIGHTILKRRLHRRRLWLISSTLARGVLTSLAGLVRYYGEPGRWELVGLLAVNGGLQISTLQMVKMYLKVGVYFHRLSCPFVMCL